MLNGHPKCVSKFNRFEREILEDALFLNRELLVRRVIENVQSRKMREARERLTYLEEHWDDDKLELVPEDCEIIQIALRNCVLFTHGLHLDHKHHWHYMTAKKTLKFIYGVSIPV